MSLTTVNTQFLEQRDAALRALDLNWAREQSGIPNATDIDMLSGLHAARYEIPSMGDALRNESRMWLQAHGFPRYGDLPWPEEDEPSTFLSRMIEERNQLVIKLTKLEDFVTNNEAFKGLDEADQKLLTQQAEVMCLYAVVLEKRITRAQAKPE